MWIAAIGTAAAAVLLAVASLGVSMAGPTPRINALTVGLVIVPIPAFAWIIYLWTRTRPTRALDVIFRIAGSCVLILVAAYCIFAAMLTAFFVG